MQFFLSTKRRGNFQAPMTIFCVNEQPKLKKEQKNKNNSIRRCKLSSNEDDDHDNVKRFHGDGLVIKMHSNQQTLKITGDGCRIVLSKNSGNVHIIGDGCKLRVHHNVGEIEYTGDGGQVILGPDSSKGKVKFVGDGGKMMFDLAPATNLKKEKKNEKICVQDFTYSYKGIANKILECKDDHRVSKLENLDILNDIKERCQGKYGKHMEETRKFLRRPTVTKIITKIQSDGQCVTKRFGDFSLIVNSDHPMAKSVSKASGANVELK